MLSLIYLEQMLEWYSLIHNVNSSDISNMIVETNNRLKNLEKSNFAAETINSVFESKNFFDEDILKEAAIISHRICVHNTEPDSELVKAKIDCQRDYLKAKEKHDFNIVKSSLDLVIKLNRNSLNENSYKKLLRDKIVDLSFKQVDSLFSDIKNITLALECKQESTNNLFVTNKQAKFIVDYLLNLLSLDTNRLEIKNSSESFMVSFGSSDVKLSINQTNQPLFTFLKTCCHEMGHALYELNNDKKYDWTFLSGAASTTFHEGIAYFFEHYVGENEGIKNHILKNILNTKANEQLSSPSPIRIESNFKNYPLHILIRYEIEKDLINGNISVDDVNKVWKQKYKEYFDISIHDDNKGILQDPHWFNNQFGYFPSYIIGRVYAAQLYNALNKNIEISNCLKNNDMSNVNKKLAHTVFKYGASKSPDEILKNATGEKFNPKYYLKELEK